VGHSTTAKIKAGITLAEKILDAAEKHIVNQAKAAEATSVETFKGLEK